MKKNLFLNLLVLVITSFVVASHSHAQGVGCAAGYDCSKRGVGDTAMGDPACGNAAWEAALVGQESGDSYTIKAPNSTARGRYQFIDSTRAGIGSKYGLPCSAKGDRAGFDSCPGLQDDYFRALVKENMDALNSVCAAHCGTVHNGVKVTMSGLLAMAHNVGAQCAKEWAIGGESNMKTVVAPGQPPCRDANGTNAVEKYAAAMGGYEVGAYAADGNNCGYGYTPGPPNVAPYQGPGSVLGCDPAVLEENKTIVDALREVNSEIIKANIQQPTPVEQMTCLDQTLKTLDASGSIHANPGGTLSASTDPFNPSKPAFGDLTFKQVENQLSNLLQIPGTIAQTVDSIWSGIAGAFNPAGILGGITGGGAPGTNCNVTEQTWLLNQCIQMPQIPSLSDMVGGKIAEVTGAIAAMPQRMIEQVCSAANAKIGGIAGNFNNAFEDAADKALAPIEDAIP